MVTEVVMGEELSCPPQVGPAGETGTLPLSRQSRSTARRTLSSVCVRVQQSKQEDVLAMLPC